MFTILRGDIITGYEVYQCYNAINRHFKSESYDFIKFRGKILAKHSTYSEKPERYFYEKVANKYNYQELIGLFLSHYSIVSNNGFFIGDVLNTEYLQNYTEFQRRIESMSFSFQQECITLRDTETPFNDIFKATDGNHPPIIQLLMGGHISIETVCIFQKLLNFMPALNKHRQDDFVWETLSMRLSNYTKFLQIPDKQKYRKIILSTFNE